MSLMTQSLRRLAERTGRLGEPPIDTEVDEATRLVAFRAAPGEDRPRERRDRANPQKEFCDPPLYRIVDSATILEAAPDDGHEVRTPPEELLQKPPQKPPGEKPHEVQHRETPQPFSVVSAAEETEIEPPSDGRLHPAPRVPPAVADLRDAVLREIGKPRQGGPGRIIVLVSIQAEEDAVPTSTALAAALVGIHPGEVLAIDASLGTIGSPAPKRKRNVHGFTSLIDGTRKLDDVVRQSETDGVWEVPSGLDKAAHQAADSTAIEQLLEECGAEFPFTLINGGDWQNAHLPPIARRADGVYFLVRANRTEQDIASSAIQRFDRLGAHVRGCILAGADNP